MNTSPKRDIEASRTVISFMAMATLENTLKKGQKNGDATKAISNASLEVTDINMPTIDAKAESNEVSMEGYRIGANGKKMQIKINKKDREMQLARIAEQNEKNALVDNDIEKD